MKNSRLYLVLDASVNPIEDLFTLAGQAVEAGVDIIQYRDNVNTHKVVLNAARRLVELIDGRVPFIINDRADIARHSGADGVHLGQHDLPPAVARRVLGDAAIIGLSCQTLEHVQCAQDDEADYIGLGSVFETQTKPERSPMDKRLLTEALALSRLPVFAIGGIGVDNMKELAELGVNRVAVTRAVSLAPDAGEAVREIKAILAGSQAGVVQW